MTSEGSKRRDFLSLVFFITKSISKRLLINNNNNHNNNNHNNHNNHNHNLHLYCSGYMNIYDHLHIIMIKN